MISFVSIIGLLSLISFTSCKVVPDIYCSSSSMEIRLPKQGIEKVILEKWSSIPGCETKEDLDSFFFNLRLDSDLECGLTSVRNKITNEVTYYHKFLVTEVGGRKHLFKASCFISARNDFKSNIVKRNVFPPEFEEPDYIEIVTEVEGWAPVPELSVGVRQKGRLIGDQVTVSPGAPLTMEVYLDGTSSPTYGILVSYMMVTDNTDKNETIIFNGCTQDRYVFENFQTLDGDYLTANFRAFKFPESDYLHFKGTVDVCLDKCQGIRCSSGEIGYGRKRRSLPTGGDPNKIFEVSMTTFLKFSKGDLGNGKSILENGQIGSRHPVSYVEEEEDIIIVKETYTNSREEESPFHLYELNEASSTIVTSLLPSLLLCLLLI